MNVSVLKGSLALLVLFAGLGLRPTSAMAATEDSDWFSNPFNHESAHHRPIGTGAIYAGPEEACTKEWLQHKGLSINNEYPWGAAFAAVGASDREVSITFASRYGTKGSSAFPLKVRIPAGKFPLNDPPASRGFDGNNSIFDRATWLIHELYEYDYHGGHPTASLHKQFDIRGLGHGSRLGDRSNGVTAAGVATTFGAVRAWELLTPGHKIGHAFQIVLPRKAKHAQPQLISKDIQWPATAGDGTACRAEDNNGHIPYGGLLAIPPVDKGGPDLTKLGLSEVGLRLGEAFRDYGLYVVDGGGHRVLRSAEKLPTALNSDLKTKDLPKLCQYLRLVKNSVQGATARIVTGMTYKAVGNIGEPTWPAGGGTPLAPSLMADPDSDGFAHERE